MQIVGPGFGPILPRMSGRIGADIVLLPIRRCAILVMRLQRLAIIHAVIAKNRAALVQPPTVAHQHIPEVVADFMPEVTKQRAVRFAHFGAAPFTLRVVSFFQGYGDQAIVVAGSTLGPVGLGLSARKSKAKPCSGSSMRTTNGSRNRCSV